MHLAYERQARQIWIVNVGDLKPLEVPISHFFDMAYDMSQFKAPDSTATWLQKWATREFGPAVAQDTANVMNLYGMYANRRKYELLDPTIYSVVNYNEAETVLDQWRNLTMMANNIYNKLNPAAQTAFFELVLHPVSAAYTVYNIYITAAKNNMFAQQRRTSANTMAQQALNLFNQDHQLTQAYHDLNNGKWNNYMSQTHIGYDWWQQPMRNTLPPLSYVQALETSLAGNLGLSVEGGNGSAPGDSRNNIANSNSTQILPPMDPYGPTSRWMDIYSRGTGSFSFKVSPGVDWVTATPTSGTIGANGNTTDTRVYLTVDWDGAPAGASVIPINVTSSTSYGNYGMPMARLPVNKTTVPDSFRGFVESDKTISIEPEHSSRNTSNGNISYAVIPSAGRTLSGVTLLPVTIPSQPVSASSPHLEYDIYLFTQTTAIISVYLTPAQNTDPLRPLRFAVSIDDAAPQVVQPIPSGSYAYSSPEPQWWISMTSNSAIVNTTIHAVTPGAHTLNLWALEPGVVFQKIVMDLGGVRPSYLGPPESMRV